VIVELSEGGRLWPSFQSGKRGDRCRGKCVGSVFQSGKLMLSSIRRERTGDCEVTRSTTVSAESESSSAKFFGVGERSSRSRSSRVDVHWSWSRGEGGVSREEVGDGERLVGGGRLFSTVVKEGVPSD
jgi:hypothetical protein